jgi:trimeric autotransporter adhesin
MKNQTLSVIHFRSRLQPSGRRPHRLSLYIICVAACVTLLPIMRAVSPPPDGGYPGNNTAEGDNALASLSSGTANTANGSGALASDTSGSSNTAVGFEALLRNTSGNNNTATGVDGLVNNTTGHENTANGVAALAGNTTGAFNTATGVSALSNNTSGSFNSANGFQALESNTNGASNTANGYQALQSNTTGSDNTANGLQALSQNTTGNFNTANGLAALFSNTTGSSNTANGDAALISNTTGSDNTASGVNALVSNTIGGNNTATGFVALANNTKGSNNVALGNFAGNKLTTGSNNIDVGANVPGVAGEANTIRIGKQGTQKATFIAGISGVAVTGSMVVVNSMGKLGVAASSARFKEAVKPMDKASEAILALKPVSFRYKEEIDPDGTPQFGLIAEQVEKVNRELVARDEEGKAYTVRYDAVNAMLLNEFLKAHRKAEAEERRVESLETTVAEQRKQIDSLTAAMEKVNARVESTVPTGSLMADNWQK